MDPITAIQLASSVIAFVDLATKVVTGTYEVYNSSTGSTAENAHIDYIIGDLEEVAAELETEVSGKSKHDRALKELASKCGRVANELLLVLNKIKSDGSDSTWKSLKATFKSMRKQKEIEGLEKRLNDYRSQILMRLTLMLQDQNYSLKMQLDRLENVSLNLSSESAMRAKVLRENVSQDMQDLLDSGASSKSSAVDSKNRLQYLEEGLRDISKLIATVPRENIILENLYFDSLDSRERTIVDAETGTFEWLFKEDAEQDKSGETGTGGDNLETSTSAEGESEDHPQSYYSVPPADVEEKPYAGEASDNPSPSQAETPKPLENEQRPVSPDGDWHEADIRYFEKEQLERRAETRTRYVAWLNSGQGIFHVSAKAGAGKSTFMKFICNHERTKSELEAWAGQKKLVFSSFYFWKSQDELQMSLEGLYRSILFTTLRQCPELIPAVFPTHWEKLKNDRFVVGNLISDFDLVNAFEALTSTGTFPNHRFCYFLDGLDEYYGHSLDHIRLVKSLQRWASNCDVKICASSRPYIEYEKLSPSPDQIVRLHLLTRHDIYLFCRQMIERDDNFEQIKDSYLSLVARVVDRSKGVFLWARLVINSLLVGMLRHDNLETLKKKLRVIPGDLNQLYDQLLSSLDEEDRARANKLLLLTAHPPFDYTVVTYWMFENFESLAFKPTTRGRPTSWPSTEEMSNDARLQIKSLTKGILETRTERFGDIEIQKVDFFHRTARDFVLAKLKPAKELKPGESVIDTIIEKHTYAKLRLAELISYDLRTRKVVWAHSFALWAFVFTPGLALEVMDAYRCVLDDYDDSVPADAKSDDIFKGHIHGIEGSGFRMHRLSFVHLAAHTGQIDYVLQEIDEDPKLLESDQELSLLLIAISESHDELTEKLIRRGCAPTDLVSCWYKAKPEDHPDGTIQIWLAVVLQLFGKFFYYKFSHDADLPMRHYITLETVLGYVQGDARSCFVLLSPFGEDTATHFITLKQFIEEVEPANKENLLLLLEEGRGSAFVKGTRDFLSRFVQVLGRSESSLASQTSAYIPYSLKEKKNMKVQAIVCNGIRVEKCWTRWY